MACQMVYHNGNCINTKKAYAYECTLCIEHCPHQAISEYRQLDTRSCTECGVCMAVCPSDGFVHQIMNKLHDYLFQSEGIVLCCPQAVRTGFEIPCIGILDRNLWLTLMLLAEKNSAKIVTGVCAECEDRQACASSVQTFKEIHEEWPEHPLIQIQIRPDRGSTEEASDEESPRETIGNQRESGVEWRQRSRKKIEEWLPTLAESETYSVPKSRQWLIEALKVSGTEKIPFYALEIDGSCTNCGVCAAICPQNALQKREEFDLTSEDVDHTKEDRIKSLKIIFEPQKCVQCNRCVDTCRSHSITFNKKLLSHRILSGKILLHEGQPAYCSRCGQRIFDNGDLCLVCATSDPEKRSFFSG